MKHKRRQKVQMATVKAEILSNILSRFQLKIISVRYFWVEEHSHVVKSCPGHTSDHRVFMICQGFTPDNAMPQQRASCIC